MNNQIAVSNQLSGKTLDELAAMFGKLKEEIDELKKQLAACQAERDRFKAALQRIADESPSGLACSEIAVEALFLSATLKSHEH